MAIGTVHKEFTTDDDSPYVNYSKIEKRTKGTKKYFIAHIAKHHTLSVYYRKDLYVTIESGRDHRTNVMVGVAVNAVGLEYNDDGTVTMANE